MKNKDKKDNRFKEKIHIYKGEAISLKNGNWLNVIEIYGYWDNTYCIKIDETEKTYIINIDDVELIYPLAGVHENYIK